ncbi:hypothetical protein [uncultured Maricaulis sp.]|uniref:hypothetical protein n=1 Tax=uncultured Maricaulis sp. TaxID=174710 RepID=UPI0030D8A704|tara:strand:- start:5320 stop:6456 length:1137 start_codon:yes stop_codon:yes gene_type:complete
MTSPALLHAGFDGLDLAYNTQIGTELQSALLHAKARAAEERRAQAVTFAGHTFLVESHGGSGGYTFSVNTGELGALWWFKEPRAGRDPWGVRVSSRALPLAVHGLDAVKTKLDQFLIDLGMIFGEADRRISRIDYALDFLFPDYSIEPDNFVAHSRRAKALDGEFSAEMRGNKFNGIRIGKMPNSQICIYDKRLEVIEKRKTFWWDIWAKATTPQSVFLTNRSPIWRFEFRAGRDALEKALGRRTWEAFTRDPAFIFRKIAHQTRLAIPQKDCNRGRWPNAAVWNECHNELERISIAHDQSVDVAKILAELRAANLRTLEAQTVGLILAQTAAYGLTESDIPAVLDQVALDIADRAINKKGGVEAQLAERTKAWNTRY